MCCNGHEGFPSRRFFWCSNNTYKFAELPKAIDSLAPVFDQI